ncbi:hypothetical protein LguiA_001988 [Lonicera macranthoides]
MLTNSPYPFFPLHSREQEDIEEVDDSECNKSDPGKMQEKEPNFCCSETKVTDESESNKAGSSRNKQEKKPKFDPATSNRVHAVEYIKYEVDKLKSHVAVLRSQIDNIRSQIDDRRSQSGSPSSIPVSPPHPNRREPGRLSPPLEIIPQDEDMPEEKVPKSPVGDFLISYSRPGSSSSKGKSVASDSSSRQYGRGHAGRRRMDDDISSELADKIAADQLMLYEDIDLLLSQVSNLTDQALELQTQADGGPRSCKPESEATRTRAEEDELKLSCAVRRSEITNKTDTTSLDHRNIDVMIVRDIMTLSNVEGRVLHKKEQLEPSLLLQLLQSDMGKQSECAAVALAGHIRNLRSPINDV